MAAPNHNAAGESLSGQRVNYNAAPRDMILVNGQRLFVENTWANGLEASNGQTFSYTQLAQVGATFA